METVFYQDRLGTNIGKNAKKSGVFLQAGFGSKSLEKTGIMGIMADLPPNKGD